MSRYIDADALIADMQERYCKSCKENGEDYNEVRCRACMVGDAIDDVDEFADNSIDIVRCKECKYYYDGHWCSEWEYLKKNPDDFCSYGERRSDG